METNQCLREGSYLRNNTYRIIRVLGQGGFGITYLAFDESLERYVAIKEFFPQGYCNRDEYTSHVTTAITSAADLVVKLRNKFLKEARNIAKFVHPGIIKIFTAFEENNTAYYVMEYIEGGSLDDLIKSTGPLNKAVAIDYINRIGHALDYIHSYRMNHLDIKPANIMLRKSDGQPILIDFGVSKQYDYTGHQTSTTPVGLSHGYSPFEQYQAGGINEFSPATDLYSLAATLYYLLTATHPPQAALLLDRELEFPNGFDPTVRNAIKKAMAPARKDRYPDVTTFLRALHGQQAVLTDDTTITNLSRQGKQVSYQKHQRQNVAPNIDPLTSEQIVDFGRPEPEKKSKNSVLLWVGIGIAAAILVFVLLVMIGRSASSQNEKEYDTVATEVESEYISEEPEIRTEKISEKKTEEKKKAESANPSPRKKSTSTASSKEKTKSSSDGKNDVAKKPAESKTLQNVPHHKDEYLIPKTSSVLKENGRSDKKLAGEIE